MKFGKLRGPRLALKGAYRSAILHYKVPLFPGAALFPIRNFTSRGSPMWHLHSCGLVFPPDILTEHTRMAAC